LAGAWSLVIVGPLHELAEPHTRHGQSRPHGQPYRPEWCGDQFVHQVEAAGMERVILHSARHSAASLLADLGLPDVAAAAWLGHTTVDVTKGYQHVMTQRLVESSKALGEVLAEQM